MDIHQVNALQFGQPVYFGRGPVEFVGRVVAVEGELVKVRGVEIGCEADALETVDIGYLDGLSLLTEEDLQRYTECDPILLMPLYPNTCPAEL